MTVPRTIRLPLSLLAISLLAACASERRTVVVQSPGAAGATRVAAPAGGRVPGGSYQVVRGDTLYSIAFRNGVDFRSLAGWNNIAEPYTIWPGQVLRLAPPGSAGAAAPATVAAAGVAKPTAPASAPPPAAPMFESVPQTAAAPAPAPGNHPPVPAIAPAPSASVASTHPAVAAPPAAAPPAAPPVPPPGTATVAVPVAGSPTAAPELAKTPVLAGGGPARAAGGVSWRWPADGSLIKRFQSGDAIPGIEIAGNAGDPVRAAADGTVVYSGNGLVGYGELIIIKHNDSLLSAYGHNRKRLVKEGQKVAAGQQIAEMGATGAARDELQFQVRRDGNPVDPMSYLPAR